MKSIVENKDIKQFISYFFVGGISAIVEWVMFALFSNAIGLNYLVATCFAFILSTATNWFLGRVWTFKGNKTYKDKKAKEIFLVFAVSAIGLVFNILIMYVLVNIFKLDTPVLRVISKVIATGIVFIWNFIIRKCVIYK